MGTLMRLPTFHPRSLALAASKWIPAIITAMALSSSQAEAKAPWENWRDLSQRDKTFLTTIFSGNEEKAAEYAQVAGINVNSLAGATLSAWFYRMAGDPGKPPFIRDPNVQRIVFERFRQNPNPPNVDETYLDRFCQYAPFPINATQAQIPEAQKPYVAAMATGFQSLLKYGVRDKTLVNAIFQGCLFKSDVVPTAQFYQNVLSPMVKAGADINGGRMRPIERAVEIFNADLVEGLVRDGAQVTMTLKGPCNAPSNLYGYLFKQLRTTDRDRLLRIVRALSSGGLPPTTKASWADTGGYGSCHFNSLYDAAVDAGNLELAKQLKEAAADTSSSKPTQAPGTASASAAAAAPDVSSPPSQIGAWRVIVENERPVAMARSLRSEGDHIEGIRLECAAGRLEYVPVALRTQIKTLWVHGPDDMQFTLPLTNGRVSGADNVALSKEFLEAEAAYARTGTKEWSIGMSIDGENEGLQAIAMTGFSRMRGHMLANCKKQG